MLPVLEEIGYSGLRFTSSIVVRLPVMKHSEAFIPTRSEERPLSLWHFARFAALLTLAMPIAMVVPAAVRGSHEVWAVATSLWLVTILAVWIVILTISCLVMISVGIWRLSKRLAQKGAGSTISHGRLWDQWMDGPEPMRS
jgi:hypothetical protein